MDDDYDVTDSILHLDEHGICDIKSSQRTKKFVTRRGSLCLQSVSPEEDDDDVSTEECDVDSWCMELNDSTVRVWTEHISNPLGPKTRRCWSTYMCSFQCVSPVYPSRFVHPFCLVCPLHPICSLRPVRPVCLVHPLRPVCPLHLLRPIYLVRPVRLIYPNSLLICNPRSHIFFSMLL